MFRYRILALMCIGILLCTGTNPVNSADPGLQTELVFIHHSSGEDWLNRGLEAALEEKSYITDVNDITYYMDVAHDTGRPDSIGGDAGDQTDMQYWILWFNDYLEHVKVHGGSNGIIMFKSCFPNSHVASAGAEPGDPFSATRTIANNKAIFRHPDGPGHTYTPYPYTYTYRPLEDIFADNPNVLFIFVTAPPLVRGSTSAEAAANARTFNNWVKNDWLNAYNAAHPGMNNVAVFDWFDVLAYGSTGAYPNRLRDDYATNASDSHPNLAADQDSTEVFATNSSNFIDTAWALFNPLPLDKKTYLPLLKRP